MPSRDLSDRLTRRARAVGLSLNPQLLQSLTAYYLLLAKWNVKVNLTAFQLAPNGDDESVDRLLIEPLLAAERVPALARSILDAGSGGGSPAIPLRLAVPRLSLWMVEAKTRKAVFLREAVRTLGLRNAQVEASRFEALLPRPDLHEAMDVVSIRAVRLESQTLLTLQAFLRPGGQMFLFRGPGGSDLAETPPPPLSWVATYPLVPALRSRLAVLEKARR
jgi:16S rRNA (guanine527-N7)-methyltransferase